MKRYLGLISLLLIISFIFLGFIFPQVLHPLPESYDNRPRQPGRERQRFVALFSVKGRLKTITLLISSLGMLGLLVLTIFAIGMILFGNFGT